MGIFSGFINDPGVRLVGVEPSGVGSETGKHAATLTYGKPGTLHGFHSYLLQEMAEGQPDPVYSIASGLDYPGVGPQHAYLKDSGRAEYHAVDDAGCLDAFMTLSRTEGIIPALESAHAVAWAMQNAAVLGKDADILVNLSGRGDKDADFVADKLGL